MLLQDILNHRMDKTASIADDKWMQGKANKSLCHTTQSWQLQVRWRDGSTSWEHLQNLKESNPIEVAEYVVANGIQDVPAFVWWVPYTQKHYKRISVLTAQKSHKFGIEVSTTLKWALEIDHITGTDYWQKAIAEEMLHVRPAFEILQCGSKQPIASKWIPCHMIFNVKMDFMQKAKFVAGGHITDPPTSITYSSIVACDSVHLTFLIAALNDLEILSANVRNAYLKATTKEKVHTTCGFEFGQQYQGCFAIIQKALYGLKSSGAAWCTMFAGTLQDIGYKASLADPDVWL